jgi:hypothetical protein
MKYPGHVVKAGEPDAQIVAALKKKLNEALALEDDDAQRLDPANPNFGPRMKQLIRLFQMRNVDGSGHPLKVDGEVGSLTWSSLFGEKSVPVSNTTASPLLSVALGIAAGEEAKKVREVPKNSNRGPQVEAYLKRTGLGGGFAWCCAFVYWCFDEAAKTQAQRNPMVKTAGCLDHWTRSKAAGAARIMKHHAVDDPGLIQPGMVFIMDYGGGTGHTGFVESVAGGLLTTIEGNTDASGTREGGGVYRLTRKVVAINKGFIDYSSVGV